MNINDMIVFIETVVENELEKCIMPCEMSVLMKLILPNGDERLMSIDKVCSWRGVYHEPCIVGNINYDDYYSDNDVVKLLGLLKVLSNGFPFYGWKGGVYRFDGSQRLNMEYEEGGFTGIGYCIIEYDENDFVFTITCEKSNI